MSLTWGTSPGSRRGSGVERNRVIGLFIVFLLFMTLISYRVVSVQAIHSNSYSQAAAAERMETDTVPARRGEIFDSRGLRLATNMGRSALAEVETLDPDVPIALEISSFQLEALDEHQLAPHVAVLTNISEDHLDRYASFDVYAEVKASIAAHQGHG